MSTSLRTGFAVALVVASAGAGLVLWKANSRLQDSVDELQHQQQVAAREKREQADQLAATARVTQAEHEELLRLRSELETLRRSQAAAAVGPTSATTSSSPIGNGGAAANSRAIPVEVMGNVGRATPRAAGQTEAWAVQHGDVDTAASLLTFAPEERTKLEAVIAALPENLREQYGTPERLMAMVMAGTPRPIAAVQILEEKEQGPDDYVQQIQLKYADGRTRDDELTFHREGDGWKRVVSPASVERVITALKNGPLPRGAGK